ncbi:MAG: hypothetical protein J6A75_00115 [Lachnospiraceae bacterium]|nr:hypothetical protein [Lachnospiraceae bacterium]
MTKLVFNAETLAKSINSENGNEIVFEEYFDIQKSEGENPKDPKFEYFKKKILDHLAELEKKENHSIAKAIDIDEWIQKANFPVGTVRTWNGQKFKKITPKKWARVYETESKGAKLAVAALRRKAAACRNSEELLQLCLENMERSRDNNGHPLPFMQEFSEYVSGLNDAHEGKKGKTVTEAKAKSDSTANMQTGEKTQEAFSKLVEEATKECEKHELSRAEMLKKPISTIQKHANSKVEDFEGGIDDFIDYMRKGQPNISMQEVGKEFAKLINHNIARKIFEDYDKGYYTVGADGILEEASKTKPKEEPKKTEPKQDNEPPKIDNEPKKKGIESIREKYQSSLSVEGDEDEIYVGKEAIQGKWKLVEADAPSASHDEITFHKTEGFPTAKDGSTVNDRDYEHDTAAQETVIDIASDFDGRALGFDSPIVVTQDGVVTSGNNRTMSSKIAARKGTDTKYIEALKKRAKKFGFSADDVAKFKHPRVVFETEHTGDYTTSEFAKYNESGKKAMNPVEKAVKVSKMIQPQTIEDVASIIGEFDTMGDLYADKKASQSIFNTLIQSNIIQKTDLPQYYSDNTVTASGKEFLETVLIGSVINETNIRNLNTEGGRSIRQKLVRAITPLIENKGMKGYSINKELNEAVGIAIEVAHHKDQFPNVEAFSKQQDMFRKLDPVSIELAKKLEGTQKGFAEFMLDMNGGLRPAANGEVDIFLGECESKEDIVNRVLNIKKTVEKALSRFFRLFGTTM